jgi:hypothetical protein
MQINLHKPKVLNLNLHPNNNNLNKTNSLLLPKLVPLLSAV